MPKKVAIITGASSGIGLAVARLAARRGYRVVLNARREHLLDEAADKIRASGGEALVVAGDIARLDTEERLVRETIDKWGRIDVLVNNAGLPLPTRYTGSDPAELRRQWDVNVTTISTLTRVALPYLEKTRGIVINIGSSISRFPVPGMGNYAPTKIAVAALSRVMRLELARKGVKVCLVEPGPISTQFTERAGGGTGASAPFSVPASKAAVPIVDLFEHPRRRIVIPGWLGPVVLVAGFLTRLLTRLLDRILFWKARAR